MKKISETIVTLTKYANINEAGLEAIESGTITPFILPDNLKQRFNVSMLFETTTNYQQNIIEPLEATEKETDINLIIAGRDYPLHATILEATFSEIFNFDRATIAVYLLGLASAELMLNEFCFDWLLFDKGNLLITAEVPQKLINTRKKLEVSYKDFGFDKVLLLNNIFHATISRMVRLPAIESTKENALSIYKEKVCAMIENIKDPLKFRVCGIHGGTAYALLNTKVKTQI